MASIRAYNARSARNYGRLLGLVSLHDHSPQPASFAGGVSWVDVNEVGPLAFDHNSILNGAIEALQTQLESHHISFELFKAHLEPAPRPV